MAGTKWYKSISFKIILSVAVVATLVNFSFALVYLKIQERELSDTILKSAGQMSETIKKSITFDMLENRKEHAYRIMQTIGEQEGIEKVRIYSSEGKIIFSSDKRELGNMVDKRAEACYACHSEEKPLESLATSSRNRIFTSPDGHRVLGMINPMHNEKGCHAVDCHFHPVEQKVLGVIDVTMSLADVDRDLSKARSQIVFFNVLSIVTISFLIVMLVMKFVAKPLKGMVVGTNRVGSGDLKYVVPTAGEDEMGQLAQSFNRMTERLSLLDGEVRNSLSDVEHRFQEKTRELKETQTHLIQTEKLAGLGKIAATVAHEINNPLTGVFTYIKVMERRIEKGRTGPNDLQEFREILATMGREVERTSAIVLNLLDFTRPKEPIRRLVDVNELIDESIAVIRNKIKMHNVEIQKNLESFPNIMIDPAQIKQVFINILVNACEAMEGGGLLTISSRLEKDGAKVIIDFQDNGIGIPPEAMSKIFDPFFTTKEKGTGLGLSVANGIVTRHNGKLEVQSTPTKGTLMRVVLPSTH